MFGSWTSATNKLSTQFRDAEPYEHVVIPDFFSSDVAARLMDAFPQPNKDDRDWKHYDNPIEQKFTLNDFSSLPEFKELFDILQSDEFVDHIRNITGIANLEADPHFHGAGLHAYPTNGKLDIHLDYSIHPITGKERRVNLIIYMNKNWKDEYGGHLELWNSELTKCTKVIAPSWNSAVLFRTNNISYHGLPKPIKCEDGEHRKSIAIYYVSEPTATAAPRYKAEFFPAPDQPVSEKLKALYDIRKHRVITSDDLEDWPSWREDGNGYW